MEKTTNKLILVIKTAVTFTLAVIIFGLSLFLPAGSLKYWNGWIFIGIFVIPLLCFYIYLYISNPKFLGKRVNIRENENIQILFRLFMPLVVLISFVISGFDYRYHWSSVSMPIIVIFALIVLAGNVMSLVVLKQNSYASQSVEIQDEQKLIDKGLYAIVRHPMYSAYSIIFCFSPFVLGSFYGLIPVVFIPLLMAARIINEEKVLLTGLKDYDLYMKKVKYRLVPYIW
jgi:protein-S-isoprenylcysteine O-methyltransferase Ste14